MGSPGAHFGSKLGSTKGLNVFNFYNVPVNIWLDLALKRSICSSLGKHGRYINSVSSIGPHSKDLATLEAILFTQEQFHDLLEHLSRRRWH